MKIENKNFKYFKIGHCLCLRKYKNMFFKIKKKKNQT